ncbi:MAG: Ca-activated chloride channel family protein [Marinoscillum sp.]|jgi:cobalamin biosynthesis protein CobT
MKSILILLLLFIADPTEIAKHNSLKKEAEKAFLKKDFAKAAQTYSELYDSLNVQDPSIGLNLAHSYFAMGDTANAQRYYQGVASGNDKISKSVAYQQLGVIAKNPKTLKESLQYLKSSLKANPMNEEARYNYELVKKLLNEQQQNQEQNQDQNQDNDEENKDKQDEENQEKEKQDQNEEGEKSEEEQQEDSESEKKEGEDGEQSEDQDAKDGEQKENEEDQKNQPPSTQEKLEEMNITEDKARMILEAMKNNEIQYIQQQKRKATKPQDSGKPDW